MDGVPGDDVFCFLMGFYSRTLRCDLSCDGFAGGNSDSGFMLVYGVLWCFLIEKKAGFNGNGRNHGGLPSFLALAT